MKIRRIDFYPDDWISGTHELADDERGVYISICMLIYARGGPIDIGLIKAWSSSHGNSFNRIIGRLEKLGKIIRNGPEIDQKRCENELERARSRIGNAKEKAAKRWKNKRLPDAATDPVDDANKQQPTYNKQQTTDSGAKAPAAASAAPIDPIKDLFDRGILLLVSSGLPSMRARTMIGKWRKHYDDPLVLEAIVKCEDEGATDPVPYITRCLANHHHGNNGNEYAPLTPASRRFNLGRQYTLDAALRAEREGKARNGEGDCD